MIEIVERAQRQIVKLRQIIDEPGDHVRCQHLSIDGGQRRGYSSVDLPAQPTAARVALR